MGYTEGNADGSFQPNEPISRLEAAGILFRVLRLEPVAEDHLAGFTDTTILTEEEKSLVNAVVADGYFGGYPDNTLRMRGTISRAEMIVS